MKEEARSLWFLVPRNGSVQCQVLDRSRRGILQVCTQLGQGTAPKGAVGDGAGLCRSYWGAELPEEPKTDLSPAVKTFNAGFLNFSKG